MNKSQREMSDEAPENNHQTDHKPVQRIPQQADINEAVHAVSIHATRARMATP
jgi:hypothetical protein